MTFILGHQLSKILSLNPALPTFPPRLEVREEKKRKKKKRHCTFYKGSITKEILNDWIVKKFSLLKGNPLKIIPYFNLYYNIYNIKIQT